MSEQFDYVVVGGGIAGCVIASRLSEAGHKTVLIEAGDTPEGNPLVGPPHACFGAHFSPIDWAYFTVPQGHLGGRPCYASAGKILSGGSATNYGTWTRGAAADFDEWAKVANSPEWSWKGLLPYFIKTETYHSSEPYDKSLHGTSGKIQVGTVSASGIPRSYPLKDTVKQMYESQGVKYNPDGNSGKVIGFSELTESSYAGQRQWASRAYLDGSNVKIVLKTMVKRVVIENGSAVGVETADGTIYKALKEVIVSAGAYRSPQLLMLSGIGPKKTLEDFSIALNADLPVGSNFHDHLALLQYWKVKKTGVAMGDPTTNGVGWDAGMPCDWVGYHHIPNLTDAAKKDGLSADEIKDLLHPEKAHSETFVLYTVAGAVDLPRDGTVITTACLGMTPTSRGSITISSASPSDPPVIDPNYYATEVDKVSMRESIRLVMKIMKESPGVKELVAEEETLGAPSGNSDADIDARVQKTAATFYHPGGSCSMGTVVDPSLKVKGIKNLRVADASIIPLPIGAHYQSIAYAIGEKAADLIMA